MMNLLAGLLCTIAVVAAAQGPEDSILAMYGDRVSRPGAGTLCIVTDQGDTLTFRDLTAVEDGENYCVHELREFLRDQNIWVIVKGCYEWTETLLVDGSDGSQTVVVSTPVPSPDGTRLLCSNEDIIAGFDDNGIQVWRADRDSLVLEFEDLDVPWGPAGARWENDSLIVFLKRTFDREQDLYNARPGWLELSGDGTWLTDDPADWN